MDDLISKQAVLDLVNDCGICIQKIVDLPSINPQKTGKWELVQYDSNPNIGNWHCSECNRIVCEEITAASPVYWYKYCPNCGAKMVEPQESEV